MLRRANRVLATVAVAGCALLGSCRYLIGIDDVHLAPDAGGQSDSSFRDAQLDAGQSDSFPDGPDQADSQSDGLPQVDGPQDGPLQEDGSQDAFIHLQQDAQQDTFVQQDAGCPPLHTGVDCQDCVSGFYKCDLDCVYSCGLCSGKLAACSSPMECVTWCSSCSASCIDCPTGYHLCPAGCQVDGTDTVAAGCRFTCDGQPCAPPSHSTAVCSSGACDFTCDATGHWVKSGYACVCDAANGFVEDSGTCVCDASQNLKLCDGACVSTTSPNNGCAAASCAACTAPAHGAAVCDGDGSCDFTCDIANHWVRGGAACGCDTGYKDCSDTCEDVTSTAKGCAGTSCDPCAPPAHGTAFCDGGGACDFTCDTAGHWVKSGASCVCDSGYSEGNGACCLTSACPGTTYNGHCYWYVSTAATWADAEAACAASQCAHLASIGDVNENSFVLGLAGADSWIGLHDTATDRRSITPDDCASGAWIDPNGGSYTGNTSSAYSDWDTCNSYSSPDVVFSLNVQMAGIWLFSTSNSSFDTVLGLYGRASGGGYTGCIGTQLACNDDVASGTNWSLIVQNLAVGQYVVVLDGYDDSCYGAYQLDARRFQWSDGSANGYNNWSPKEPNNSGSNEYCVQMHKSPNAGQWADVACNSTLPYVCERAF